MQDGDVSKLGDELHLHDSDSIVVKDCGHVFGRKLIRGVADQEAGLANSTVSDHDTSVQVRSCQQIRPIGRTKRMWRLQQVNTLGR